MTRVAILEDEKPAREGLVRALRRFDPAIEIAFVAASVAEAVRRLGGGPPPDLILADIQLSDGLSLAAFETVPAPCPIIFCTAYDEHVLEALRRGGIDYLVKPIEEARLHEALAKYLRLRAHFAGRPAEVARALQAPERRGVVARHERDFVPVPIEQIAYFVAEDKTVVLVHRSGARYGIERTLTELEAELPGDRFFRANRSFLVHRAAVRRFRPWFKGRLALDLDPGAEDVIVSQENAARFRGWMDR